MAAEVTAQAIVHAKLVDSPLSECSTVRVNDLVNERKYYYYYYYYFLKARLSCQTNASVSKSEK